MRSLLEQFETLLKIKAEMRKKFGRLSEQDHAAWREARGYAKACQDILANFSILPSQKKQLELVVEKAKKVGVI